MGATAWLEAVEAMAWVWVGLAGVVAWEVLKVDTVGVLDILLDMEVLVSLLVVEDTVPTVILRLEEFLLMAILNKGAWGVWDITAQPGEDTLAMEPHLVHLVLLTTAVEHRVMVEPEHTAEATAVGLGCQGRQQILELTPRLAKNLEETT